MRLLGPVKVGTTIGKRTTLNFHNLSLLSSRIYSLFDAILRLHPLHVTDALRQRNMAQMKEEIKSPEKELSNEG